MGLRVAPDIRERCMSANTCRVVLLLLLLVTACKVYSSRGSDGNEFLSL